jgi:hypothetical protein
VKKKREHKVSLGIHGAGGKTRLSESERPASVTGGIVARFKPVGEDRSTKTGPFEKRGGYGARR